MGIAETLEYIHSVKWRGSKPGLERTRELLLSLGSPEKHLKFVHIAGTNGKGSTAAMIAAVLREAGYRTGLFTSPYITCFNERMQVNGRFISDYDLELLTDGIRPFADAMEDPPTEFELITALAMKFFLYQKCDIVVLETGMGGELDSTNVIDTPEAAVITSIGFDHVKELGPTLADIATAKAGIIKSGGDVMIYGGESEAATVFPWTNGGESEVEAVFGRVSAEKGARLIKADFSRITSQEFSIEGTRFGFSPYGAISIPLAGSYQPKNAALAITALEVLRGKGYRISDDDVISGLSAVKWPGRFELLGRDPVFILDGAHNPQGVRAAAESLRRCFGERKVIFVVGVMADKDVDSMIGHLAAQAEAFIAVRPDYYRAMGANELASRLSCSGAPVFAFDTVTEGVAEAVRRAGKDGIVCALGSLYFSADIREAYRLYATRLI